MIRGALAVATVGTAITGLIVTGHHITKRPEPTGSAKLAPVVPLARTSRGEVREPLPRRQHRRFTGEGATPPRRAPVRHLVPHDLRRGNGSYADTTMYCATGNRNAAGRWPQLGDVAVADRSIPFGTRVIIGGRSYRVEDWIGWGSQFDIFGCDDEDCEQRALDYGRRHLRVVVER